MKNLDAGEYKRIRKDVARRSFEKGRTIYLTPSNIAASDSNPWIRPHDISNKSGKNFDSIVNAYECYNCNCNQLGYYSNYWIKEE